MPGMYKLSSLLHSTNPSYLFGMDFLHGSLNKMVEKFLYNYYICCQNASIGCTEHVISEVDT